METDKLIPKILRESKVIAVVGLSPKPDRSSHSVSAHLQKNGYRIIPVYPKEEAILGEKVFRSLGEIPFPVDIVLIFRKSEDVPPVVEEAIRIKPKTIWMQQGIVNETAAKSAESMGIQVIMDRCMSLELAKFNSPKE